jgi:N6-adenosine-specific RNA methylase IME4
VKLRAVNRQGTSIETGGLIVERRMPDEAWNSSGSLKVNNKSGVAGKLCRDKGDRTMEFNIDKKYQIIYADPPWPEHGGGKIKRGADRHYPLMSVNEIKSLPVEKIALENCHLYLWVTNNYLPAGLEVMKAWGFTYKTTITWGKDRIGLGQYFRGLTEHCLFGTKGKIPYKIVNGKRSQGRTLFIAPKTFLSAKPEAMREMIGKVS